MMIAKYYNKEVPYATSGEWHLDYTGGNDYRLFPADIQNLLHKTGINSGIDWDREYIDDAMSGKFPMVYLLEDQSHWVVIYNGYVLDPLGRIAPININDLPFGFGIYPIPDTTQRPAITETTFQLNRIK